eukprot:1448050-Pyramimonas_sp.AAC.1
MLKKFSSSVGGVAKRSSLGGLLGASRSSLGSGGLFLAILNLPAPPWSPLGPFRGVPQSGVRVSECGTWRLVRFRRFGFAVRAGFDRQVRFAPADSVSVGPVWAPVWAVRLQDPPVHGYQFGSNPSCLSVWPR